MRRYSAAREAEEHSPARETIGCALLATASRHDAREAKAEQREAGRLGNRGQEAANLPARKDRFESHLKQPFVAGALVISAAISNTFV